MSILITASFVEGGLLSRRDNVQTISNRAFDPCNIICDDVVGDRRICGSDGITYKSRCDYENAQCTAQKTGNNLFMENYGPCVDFNTTCVEVADVKCLSHNFKNQSELICGSDRHTYTSVCSFMYSKCQSLVAGRNIGFAHYGSCETVNGTTMIDCSPYVEDTTGLALESGGITLIMKSCPRQHDPICSINGYTYDTECSYCGYLAHYRKIIGLILLSSVSFVFSRTAVKQHISNRASLLDCDIICDDIVTDERVCGSDGVTYKSECDFRNAQCRAERAGGHVARVNYGPCINETSDCSDVAAVKCLYQTVTDQSKLLCGSDGRTYSQCTYLVSKCRYVLTGKALAINHTGSCEAANGTVTLDCRPYVLDTTGLALESSDLTLIVMACPATKDPICSIDVKTFSNECRYCASLAHLRKIRIALLFNLQTYWEFGYYDGYGSWQAAPRTNTLLVLVIILVIAIAKRTHFFLWAACNKQEISLKKKIDGVNLPANRQKLLE